MQFSAELEGVLTPDVRDVIDELNARVRPLHLGPIKSAQLLRKNVIRKNADARQSAIERIGYSRIESVFVLYVCVVIVSESGLVKAVITEASYVNPPRARHKDPVLAKNLGARVNLCKPFRLQLTR